MSSDRASAHTCAKKSYLNKEDAVRVAAHRNRKGATFLRIYYCGSCSAYHLTKRPRREG